MRGCSDIIDLALAEDIGTGDLTVRYFCAPGRQAHGRIVAREPCVLAGRDVAEEVFTRVDKSLEVTQVCRDGEALSAGAVALDIIGPAGSLLTAERVALNFLQRLSGVATLTRKYVEAVQGTGVTLLDTRKTTPGFRSLEKAAVLAGGASNLRMGLYDMVMVKDNHLAAGAGVEELRNAIDTIKREKPHVKIELEADTLDQVRAFYELKGVDVILLDNMTVAQMREAVAGRPAGIRLEASGGVNLHTVRAIAETGVDFISIGALTHSAPSVDFSLEIDGD